ncbi:MAG: metallophosphoesterase family protein [Desulfurococcales archaeon]|nr:metallophosphoesterase family protein [Desulfurococcales archaeon]
MKVMAISDLHYDRRVFHGVDRSKAWGWLLSIVDYHKPNLLLSCDDWGTAISFEEFYVLLKKAIVLTIYGNHENMDVLIKLYNVKTNEYLPVLMEDARIYEYAGLRIAGINGIIARKRKVKKGVPRKTPEEFLGAAEKLRNKGIDLLLIHETPYLPELFPFMRDSISSRTALRAIEIVKPRVVFNGQMHFGGYKIYEFSYGTKYVYLDSSQANRHYAILYTNNAKLEMWRDGEVVDVAEYL